MLLAALWLRPTPVMADEVASPSETSQPAERSVVRVLTLGGSESRTRTLQTLIEAELSGTGISVVMAPSGSSTQPWFDAGETDASVLLMAVLDMRRHDTWQLTIVDAARRRAIRRQLPGGVAEDAAALEAMASIVVSAVVALRDGLEVASQPVEEVLEGVEAKPESRKAPAVTESAPSHSVSPPPAPEAPSPVAVGGALLGTTASYAEPEPATFGLGLALGMTIRSTGFIRLSAARYQNVAFHSEFGRFTTTRNAFGLGAGLRFGAGWFALEPEFRFVVELIERGGVEPSEGVQAQQDSLITRSGGLLGVRGRIFSGSPVGLELFLGGGYLPRPVRFVTKPNNGEIAELWPWVALAEFGFSFGSQ